MYIPYSYIYILILLYIPYSYIYILILHITVFDRYDREGGAQQAAQPLSDARASGGRMAERRCTLAQITDEGMGTSGQPAFVQVPLTQPCGKTCFVLHPSRPHVVGHKHADRCANQTCREERTMPLGFD